ncbi:MAG TPA: hypothetical protein VGX23_11945 [Actinocrinis sp.]|nr:hypothetical protein [Actinocrinis sp.]
MKFTIEAVWYPANAAAIEYEFLQRREVSEADYAADVARGLRGASRFHNERIGTARSEMLMLGQAEEFGVRWLAQHAGMDPECDNLVFRYGIDADRAEIRRRTEPGD